MNQYEDIILLFIPCYIIDIPPKLVHSEAKLITIASRDITDIESITMKTQPITVDNNTFYAELYYILWEQKIMSMRRLTKPERDDLVLDLYYNQNKTYRQIAKEARICPRDIKHILDQDVQGAQGEQSMSVSSKAYELFSEGKSPLECAKTLNLREPEVTQLYKECWNLTQLYDLNQLYLETKGYLAPLLKLYRSIKAAGMGIQHVLKLLRIANNDLSSVEHRYENLRTEVNSLEEQKWELNRIILELDNQRTEVSNYVEHYKASCRQEYTKRESLRHEKMKLEAIVSQFKNNNKEYLEIRRIAEEKVYSTLSDSKVLLKYASLSLVESMKKDPEKFSSLIYNNIFSPASPTWNYLRQYHDASDTYGKGVQHSPPDHYSDACIHMLNEQAEEVFNKLANELIEESITDYVSNTTSSLPSLPPPCDEK